MGFASRRRHLLRAPPAPPRRSCEGSHTFPPTPGTGRRQPGAKSPRRSAERCRRRGGGCGRRRNREPRGGGGRGSAVSKVSCPREAKDCSGGGGGGGQRACVSSRPAPSSRLLSPPPPLALCSAFPRSRPVQPRACLRRPGRGPRLLPRAGAGLPLRSLGAGRGGDHGVGERLSQFCELFGFFDLESLPAPKAVFHGRIRLTDDPPPLAPGHLQWARRWSAWSAFVISRHPGTP